MITRILMGPQEVANKLEKAKENDHIRAAADDFAESLKRKQLAGLLAYTREQLIRWDRKLQLKQNELNDLGIHLHGADNRIRDLESELHYAEGSLRDKLQQANHALEESEKYRLRVCAILSKNGLDNAGADYVCYPEHLGLETRLEDLEAERNVLTSQLATAQKIAKDTLGELEFYKRGLERFNRGGNSMLSKRVLEALAEDEKYDRWEQERAMAVEEENRKILLQVEENRKLLQNEKQPPSMGTILSALQVESLMTQGAVNLGRHYQRTQQVELGQKESPAETELEIDCCDRDAPEY